MTKTNDKARMGLDTSTLLVTMTCSVWTARKLDRKVSDEVVHEKSAGAKGAARVNKSLMAGRSELTDIQAIVGAARNYLYDNTVPWSDAGQRLLPAVRLLKVDQRMSDYKAEFDAKVAEFVAIYPTLITAQAMALGDMFDRSEFPTATQIEAKFAFSCEYEPVPSAGDFRIDIGNTALEELRARLEASADARVKRATDDVKTRLVEHLERMSERLVSDTDDVGDPKARRFRDTLVSSAFELCDLVGDMNLTGDANLALARSKLETALTGCSAETLRRDDTKREDVRQTVNEVLDLFKF